MRSAWAKRHKDGSEPSPNRLWRPTRAVPVVFALLMLTAAAEAADWVATKVQGTVIRLVDDRWLELSAGEAVSEGQAVRTLQSGRVELYLDGLQISLTRNTVMMVTGDSRVGGAQLHQYSGQVAVSASSDRRYTITTPDLVIVGSGATVVSVGDGMSRVQVVEGEAHIADVSGQRIALHAGEVGISTGGDLVVAGTLVDGSVSAAGVASAEQSTYLEAPTIDGSTLASGESSAAAVGTPNGDGGSQKGAGKGSACTDNGDGGGSNGNSTGNNGNNGNAVGNGNSNGNNGVGGSSSQSTGNNANENNNGRASEADSKGSGGKK